MEVQVFGSFASGLNTWSSDVDMVVTGIMKPDKATGAPEKSGFVRISRACVQRKHKAPASCCSPGWQVFGSFASGLNTWSSDVDMVVTGIMKPDKATGGYDVADRGRVTARLRRIGEGLRRCKALESPRITIIPKARIPIIKVRVRSVDVDISLSDETGVKAAHYLAQQVFRVEFIGLSS
ncbi:poly(A) polymerase [Haematococcus lacustris]|uniref:Poly(A) polymerase n=1 Tax=Haematococcus lacustris TaxID=44745 RepID=A0A699Z7J0_HAELA|nr:poly(A) polymerase [Haematococcus lacustris]